MKRILIISMILFSLQSAASVFSPSYEERLKEFNKKREESGFTLSEEDKQIMQNAGEYITKYLPNPGIKVGEKAPEFTLKNAFGELVSLQEQLKKGPVVVVFYRGSWCPYCNLHLKALQESLPAFNKYKANLIAITPQQPDKSAQQLAKDGFQFEVLSDLNSKVMKAYNLYFELPADLVALYKKFGIDLESYNGSGRTVLPVPGSFVIDSKGIVRAMHATTDYKQRIEPGAILDALALIDKGE